MTVTVSLDPHQPGRYRVRWPRPGRTRTGRPRTGVRGGFKTQRDARRYGEAQVEAERGQLAPRSNDKTLGAFAHRWLAAYREHPPATQHNYAWRVAVITETWGTTPVTELDGTALDQWLTDLPLGGSIKDVRSSFRSIMRFVVSQGAIPVSPFDTVWKPRAPRSRRQVTVKAGIAPPWADIEAVRAKLPAHLRILVDLGALAGLRPGEARGVRLQSIDFHTATLRVVSQIDATGDTWAPTKNGKQRAVPMSRLLMDRLSEHLLLHPAGADGGLIVANAYGGPVLDHVLGNGRWQRAVREAGVAPFRMHDLRHYFATVALGLGIDVATVAEWLEHEPTGRTTRATYAHAIPAAGRLLRDALDLMSTVENAPETRPDSTLRASDLGE